MMNIYIYININNDEKIYINTNNFIKRKKKSIK